MHAEAMLCENSSFLYLTRSYSLQCQFILLYVKSAFLGGALKPTDVETLWVHVTCAWFRPEVGFLNHEKMEPATGILRIPTNSFLKVHFAHIDP